MQPDDAEPRRGRLRLLLTPDQNAPAAARRALRDLPLGERGDDVLLLASELVTNAVVHGAVAADEPIELEAECDDGCARVEVRNRGSGFVRERAAGYGLLIVAAATDRWGLSQDGATCVWFEVATHAWGRLRGAPMGRGGFEPPSVGL